VKRGTPSHPKTHELASLLHVRHVTALGHLELLFHFTAQYAPEGNIGRYSEKRIAAALEWSGKPSHLINALVAAGWLDRYNPSPSTPQECYNPSPLVVHDWCDHADRSTLQRLARNGKKPIQLIQTDTDKVCAQSDPDTYTPPSQSQSQSQSQSLARALPEPPRAARQTDLRSSLADNSEWDLFVAEWGRQTGGDSGWPMGQQLFAGVVAEIGIEKLLDSVRAFGRSDPWKNGKIDNMGKWFSARRYLETPPPAKVIAKDGQRSEAFRELTVRRIGNAV